MVHSYTISTLKIAFVSTEDQIPSRNIKDYNEVGGFANSGHKYRILIDPITVRKPTYGVVGSEEGKGGLDKNKL